MILFMDVEHSFKLLSYQNHYYQIIITISFNYSGHYHFITTIITTVALSLSRSMNDYELRPRLCPAAFRQDQDSTFHQILGYIYIYGIYIRSLDGFNRQLKPADMVLAFLACWKHMACMVASSASP